MQRIGKLYEFLVYCIMTIAAHEHSKYRCSTTYITKTELGHRIYVSGNVTHESSLILPTPPSLDPFQ